MARPIYKRKSIVIPLGVVVTLVAAFLGYGAYTRSQPTHYSRGGAFQVGEGAPSLSPSATAGPSASPTGSASPGASASAAPSASASANATTAAAPTVEPVPTPTHVGLAVLPVVGRYGLKVSGVESVKFGPFTGCTNNYPASSSLTISKAAGEKGNSFNFDLRYYPSSPGRHDERQIYRYDPDGSVSKSYEIATVTCAGVKQSSEVDYSPVQLRVGPHLHVGQAWTVHGGGKDRTESGTFTVTGQSTLSVAGHTYSVFIIDAPLTLTGSESGKRDQTWWWSPQLAIPLQFKESYDAKRSGASYSNHVTATIVSLP